MPSSAVEWLQAAAQDAANSTSSSSRSGTAALLRPVQLGPKIRCRVMSLSTCTKVGAITFVVGVAVGFPLKRRLRLWAARLLKRIKDDD
ncbi:unnamed protein product [Alopecurus aequalis]